jgi:FkbM family methyltransferase
MLSVIGHLPGKIGRHARKQLATRWGRRALRDFQEKLDQLRPGDVCIDLGANVGVFTEKFAALGAEVHAYEPDPWSFEKLSQRLADLPNVHLHNVAVAAQPGKALLRRSNRFAENPERFSHSSSIVRDDPERYGEDGFEVEVRSFADVLAAIGRPVALVKIDIEGAEYDLLEAVLARPADFPVAAIFVETHERDDPALIARVRKMRRDAEVLMSPSINMYWP